MNEPLLPGNVLKLSDRPTPHVTTLLFHNMDIIYYNRVPQIGLLGA